MTLRAVKSSLLVLYCALVTVASLEDVWVELRAPRFVVHGHSAVFKCDHNVEPQTLYKVVFFKSGQRIMQYVQGRDPPFERYNFTGGSLNLMKMTPTSITVEKMDFTASGPYACEIALEIPLYSKASKIHEVNVIVRQNLRPKIRIKHKKLSLNDALEATCQSGPAYPAPHLTWLINNVKVDEKLTIPHGTVNVRRHHHGMPLSITNSSLRFPVTRIQPNPKQTVDITCLSTIPSYASIEEGYADVQKHTVTVKVVRMEPTLVTSHLPVKTISLVTKNSITLDNLNPTAFGLYWCEVSIETPIFTAASPPFQLTVVSAVNELSLRRPRSETSYANATSSRLLQYPIILLRCC